MRATLPPLAPFHDSGGTDDLPGLVLVPDVDRGAVAKLLNELAHARLGFAFGVEDLGLQGLVPFRPPFHLVAHDPIPAP
jgi:hypothetical protein